MHVKCCGKVPHRNPRGRKNPLITCKEQGEFPTYGKVQYSTVQYSTVQYSTVQYSSVQYSTAYPREEIVLKKSEGKRHEEYRTRGSIW